ncbi:sulfurtransferase [Gemmata sp. JC673]|uniref:Sulfurtransferase n=1 Tax=Gemmata algarum TaxID=2975278 RepID=A0ABU5EZG6_9BACT|nr:sulfurtransferase [Gemmata algarum]MDY3560495.1 sulfurtransferase [Gemmata algarum]
MTKLAIPMTVLTLAISFEGRAAEYPRPELLTEPAALAQKDAGQGFVILDARAKAQYEAGHVPGARWVDHAEWANSFGDGKDAGVWSKRIGSIGLTADSRVVVYDDNQAKDAARVWWILRYWGVKDVRLLNGGWVGWEKGKYPTERAEPAIKFSAFKAVAAPERMATKDELLKSLPGGTLQIVDARSEGEFCGVDTLKNKRAGAIPGAKQLEWVDLIEKDSQRFKSPTELKKLFDGAGIKLDRSTVTHCQSGGRASVMAYGLELMGAKDVRNYYRSWSEWGNADDTPVVKPNKK